MHKIFIPLVLVALASATSTPPQALLERKLLIRERIEAESDIIEFNRGARAAKATPSPTHQRTDSTFDADVGKLHNASILKPARRRGVSIQRSDADFNVRVARPAYVKRHPKVLFDEVHNNPDTSTGRYRPFADLITSDGYNVTPGTQAFSRNVLRRYEVCVIVNASGPQDKREASAFTEEECNAVRDWVRSGGALLLITDHAPFSTAVAQLSKRFGVDLTNGYTVEKVHYNKESDDQTEIVFSRDDGLIGDHAIANGRNEAERINRVITFAGTSIKGPNRSVAFLKLADTAIDVLPPERKPEASDSPPADHRPVSAAGRAQGIAFEFGKGRVVVLSEAAMLTAQVTPRGIRFGMNVPGIDNRQLALNIMHWLSGLLR